jgi:hypothetical protein
VKKNEHLSLADCAAELRSVLPHKNRLTEEELKQFATRISSSLIRHRLINQSNQVWVNMGGYDLGHERYPTREDRFVSTWMQAGISYHGEARIEGLDKFVRPSHQPIIGIEFVPEETFFATECNLGYSVGFFVPDGHELSFGSRLLVQ